MFFKDSDEKLIEKWIKDGEITCELEEPFEWIIAEYKRKKKKQKIEQSQLAEEIKGGFLYTTGAK